MKTQPNYTVIYEDDSIVVLNKVSGLLVAQDRYDKEAPRLDKLAEQQFGKLLAVHRIDKDTSGIVIYARTAEAHRFLSIAFERREVHKTYHALVHGRPEWTEFTSKEKLLPDGDIRHRTVVNKRFGKESITNFRLIGTAGPFSWIEADPLTGRTHQIRAHLANCGISIVCDPLYSGNQKPVRLSDIKKSWRGDVYEERPLLSRLALHAYKLTVKHPVTQQEMTFVAPYQKDMDSLRKQLAKLFKTDPLAQGDFDAGVEHGVAFAGKTNGTFVDHGVAFAGKTNGTFIDHGVAFAGKTNGTFIDHGVASVDTPKSK